MLKRILLFLTTSILYTNFLHAIPGATCGEAISVGSTSCNTYNNTGITGTMAPSCIGAGTNNSMWFSFIASTTAVSITADGGTPNTIGNILAALYSNTGGCGGSFSELSCNNPNLTSCSIDFQSLIIGNTYYILVDGRASNVGTFNLCLSSYTPPSYMITNGTVNTCTGTFFDTGGGAGNYGNNQNFIYTICSDNAQPIFVDFKSFALENNLDYIKIYDGPTTSAPLIGQYTGTNSPGLVHTGGGTCLTFEFFSDAATTNTGWEAIIGCGVPPTPQNSLILNTSGTWTVPCGVTSIYAECFGGGGGGGGDNTTATAQSGGGGGGGGYAASNFGVTPSQTINYSVGASGIGGLGTNGSNGGTTTFLSLTANGGSGGISGTSGGAGGAGGVGSGGSINISGNPGMNSSGVSSGAGGNSGGVSIFGLGGASVNTSMNGINGGSPGGGGGGAYHTGGGQKSGGNGGNGGVQITFDDPAPHVTSQNTLSQTRCEGAPFSSMGIVATGSSLGFQWYSNTTPSYFGATALSGETTASYTPSSLSPGTFYYFCIVSSPCGPNDTSYISGPQIVNPRPSMQPVTKVDISCFGANDGQILGNATGGISPYIYSIDGGSTFPGTVITGLSAGSYTVHVKDANGCISSNWQATNIIEPPQVILNLDNLTHPSCVGSTNAQIVVSGSNGIAPYMFKIDGGGFSTSSTFSGLSAGTVTVQTRDNNNCLSAPSIYILTDPPALVAGIASQVNVTCFGGSTGSLNSSVSGGTGTYNFIWSNSATTANIGGLPAGAYSYTVSDGNGCTASFSATITQPSSISLSTSGNSSPCSATAMNIILTASGGSGSGYTYSWLTLDNSNTTGETFGTPSTANPMADVVTNNTAGVIGLTYTVTVTDGAGCTSGSTVNASINPAPTLTPISNQTLCAGSISSPINFSASIGGTTVSWTNSNTSIGIAASGTGNIAATTLTNGGGSMITGNFVATPNFSGCVGPTQSFNISVNPLPVVTASSSSPTICQGQNANFTSSGANTYNWSPVTYLNSNTISNPIFTGSTLGSFNYTVTGTNTLTTCSNTAIVNVTVNAVPASPTITAPGSICAGSTLNLSTPSVATSYFWSGPNSFTSTLQNPSIAGITAAGSGTYSLTVTNGGCTSPTNTFNISVNLSPNITSVAAKTVCSGVALGHALTSSVAGTTYTWLTNDNVNTTGESTTIQTTSTINNTIVNSSGVAQNLTYTVTPTAAGCTGSPQNFVVTVNPKPTMTSGTAATVCSGTPLNFALTSDIPSTYSWIANDNGFTSGESTTAQSTSTITDNILNTTGSSQIIVYNVTPTAVTGGCIGLTQTVNVTVNVVPFTPLPSNNGPLCVGSTLNLSAGMTASIYNWTGPNSFSSTLQNPSISGITIAGSGTYSLTLTSAGCTSGVGTTVVNVDSPPTLPNAGPDQNVCTTTTTLAGNAPAIGTGTWSVVSGGVTITSSSSPNSGLTGMSPGTNVLRWTISNGTCPSSSDDVNIIVSAPPSISNAGTDQNLCGLTSTNLSANTPTVGTGMWSIVSGTATITTPSSPTSSITGLTIGASVTLRWAITSGLCPASTDDVVITSNTIPTISGTLSACVGQTSTLSGSGTPSSWVSSMPSDASINAGGVVTALNPGTVNISYTNSTGCSTSSTFTVNAIPNASITASGPLTFCSGNTVTFTALPNSGVNYQWKHGTTNVGTNADTYTTGNAGNHTVIVTDLITGCSDTSNMLNVNVDANPTISSVTPSSSSICDGSSTLINLSQIGGDTYSWSPAISLDNSSIQNPTASPTTNTIYTVTVTNSTSSCSSSSTAVVNVTSIPTVSSTVANVTCFGAANGSITINATGGTPLYNYSIDNISFGTTNNFTALTAGSYTLYVKDANNCVGQNTASITQPASGFLISSSGSTNICSGQVWSETFNSSGGFGSITYSWAAQPPTNVTGASSGSGNTINEILTATTTNPYIPETVIYDLFATDQNGCNATSTFTVNVNPLPYVNLSSDINPICISQIANLTASPTSDFFGWNPTTDLTIINANSASFAPSSTGTFVITYTVSMSLGGCFNSGSITLTVTPAPSAPLLGSNSPVCATNAINLNANPIGGATYSWTGPNGFVSTSQNPIKPGAIPADAGTYTCTILLGGCTSSSTVNVIVNPKPQAIIPGVSTNFCANETFTLDGSSSIANSSTITNYQWQIGGSNIAGANSPTYTGNTPGNYSLIVTNDLGCTDMTLTPNIVSADSIPTSVINGPVSFCTGNTITLDAFSSTGGGASTINNYEWLFNGSSVASGSTINTYNVAAGGDYQLIILNSNGCKDTTVLYTVTENPIPSLPSVTPDPINVCVGGSANISVNSPIATSTYTWASINAEVSVSLPTGTSNTVNGLTAGIASITVTETNSSGCTGPTYSVTVNIISAPIATASLTSNDTICYNGNASVALNLITGASYNWTSSIGNTSTSQSATFNNIITTGNVEFYGTITDGNGCTSTQDTIVLFVRPQPATPTITNPSPVCPNQPFTLFVNPVITGADYYWTDPSTATQNGINLTSINIPSATASAAGPYVVNYIDPFGCTSPNSSLYNQPIDPKPIVSITGLTTICSGNSTTLNASTSIGTASAYQWFNNGSSIAGATSPSLVVSTPGNYNVEIILSTGCFDTASVATNVNVSSGPSVVVNPLSSTICAGSSATLNASGAVSYSWDNGATTSSITVNPTITTSYTVTGTDANGCTKNDTAIVVVNALPATPVITTSSTSECAGTTVSLSSNSTLTNTWINNSTLAVIGTTQSISHTETVAGTYNYGVYVTDGNSCNSATATVSITYNSCLTNLISDNATTSSNTPVSGNYLTNDGSPSIFTTVNIISGPGNGTMSVSTNGNFIYTPAGNFSGYDMIVVQVCDATPTCLFDTIYITVNPNIIGDTYTVNGLATPNSIIGNVLINDAGTGISGNVTLVNSVSNGILVIDTLGNFTYTPNAGFCGNDLFTYNVCDQNGLCANAGVNIIVTCDSTVTTTTGFSPNGDGVNDNWIIQGIETTQNTVTIFDRWGNQVISFTNYNNANTSWDGRNSNGVELPSGTYFYSIDIPNEKSKKGWVEITK